MFLNKIKDFFIRKILNSTITNVKYFESNASVQKVGILFDGSQFDNIDDLIGELVKEGILLNNIKFLVFNNDIKQQKYNYPTFSIKNIGWTGKSNTPLIKNFINQKFDMLINYYDTEIPALMIISNNSKANFKVGFDAIDKRLNHFIIKIRIENYKIFIEELFKYLKILNKL